jgi:hypothetical protein
MSGERPSATLRDMSGEVGSWFLVSWPEHGRPVVEMEFWTREEAEAARDQTLRICGDGGRDGDRFGTGVCPAAALTADPFLQEALLAWDEQLEELESIERRVLRGD